jgi:hypothetical protein
VANKEKILKKKEQLADGLHLIDFEQLKIENQTLNEKIEERNEELHKLRNKITTTVVILSHTREKLQFVVEKNRDENQDRRKYEDQLKALKDQLSKQKKKRETLWKENQKLKQQTGIFNNQSLKMDYQNREAEISVLETGIITLKNKHARLTELVKRAEAVKMQQNI